MNKLILCVVLFLSSIFCISTFCDVTVQEAEVKATAIVATQTQTTSCLGDRICYIRDIIYSTVSWFKDLVLNFWYMTKVVINKICFHRIIE